MENTAKSKRLITSPNKEHTFPYKKSNALISIMQKLVIFAWKNIRTDKVITEDKNGKKHYSMHIYSRFNIIFLLFYLWGLIMRILPRKIGDRLFAKFKEFGLDWSKVMMSGMPIEDFKENASFVIVPDSKYNEIKTSDGKMIFPHLFRRRCLQ